jgi:hypothetical protein
MRAPVRSIAFVLVAIIAATLLGWLWLATPPLPANGELPADTKTTAPQLASGSLADATNAGDARTQAAATAQRPVNAGAPPQTQWLRVVDGITRAPLPQATIHFEDRRVDYQQLPAAEVAASWDDPEAFAQKHGQTVRSDGDGRVAIQFHGLCRAYGRLGERFGEVQFGDGFSPAVDPQFPGEVVLPLYADQNLRLRLVDDGAR